LAEQRRAGFVHDRRRDEVQAVGAGLCDGGHGDGQDVTHDREVSVVTGQQRRPGARDAVHVRGDGVPRRTEGLGGEEVQLIRDASSRDVQEYSLGLKLLEALLAAFKQF